jgi:pimeloyl-ACP methyl ester carboxylesterase
MHGLAALLPLADTLVVPRCGHALHEQRPEELLHILLAFTGEWLPLEGRGCV